MRLSLSPTTKGFGAMTQHQPALSELGDVLIGTDATLSSSRVMVAACRS